MTLLEESLNNLLEFEKEGKLDLKTSENFKIKSKFSFFREGETLDKIIKNREEKIKKFGTDYDPKERKEMQEAIKILIENKDSRIALVSDYDVDGITGSLVLTSQLLSAGYKFVYPIIPERKDGYGISEKLVDKAVKEDCSIIITIDNGTGAREAIEYAKEKGIIVIVTDHHLADEDTISNPQVLINYNMWTDQYALSGCGVAYTLGKLLIEELGLSEEEKFKRLDKEMLGLVSVSIIADVCPLYGINRKIVEENLNNIRNSSNYALRSLVSEVCGDGFYPEIGFGLAPVINSMGRYNRANEIFNYFARKISDIELKDKKRKEIIDFNEFRKGEVSRLLERSESMINQLDFFNLILFDEKVEYGLLGLVAGRIASSTGKITLVGKKVIQEDGSIRYHGSGRTGSLGIISTVKELKEIHQEVKDVFVAGHDAACGFGISGEDVGIFKDLMNEHIGKKNLEYSEEVDTILPSPDCFTKEEILRSEKILWGQGYESPSFATRNMRVLSIEKIGESNHYRLRLLDKNGYDFEFTFFNGRMFLEGIREGDKVDILYTISINRWLGKEKIQYLSYNIKKSL